VVRRKRTSPRAFGSVTVAGKARPPCIETVLNQRRKQDGAVLTALEPAISTGKRDPEKPEGTGSR